jgi:hypothetical protein
MHLAESEQMLFDTIRPVGGFVALCVKLCYVPTFGTFTKCLLLMLYTISVSDIPWPFELPFLKLGLLCNEFESLLKLLKPSAGLFRLLFSDNKVYRFDEFRFCSMFY